MIALLFIEDDPGSGLLYEKVCSILGHQFILADSGNQGLNLAKEKQPDLIVVDLSLPDLDGFNVIKRLRQEPATKHIPIVIISAATNEELEMACLSSGAEAFLAKPLDIPAFRKLIDHYTITLR